MPSLPLSLERKRAIVRQAGLELIVNTSNPRVLSRVEGWEIYHTRPWCFRATNATPIVFRRDGGLSKVDILRRVLKKRIVQAGNSIGGAISQDGRLIALWVGSRGVAHVQNTAFTRLGTGH